MSFSSEFLGFIVYGALICCGLTAIGLGTLLVRDITEGNIW